MPLPFQYLSKKGGLSCALGSAISFSKKWSPIEIVGSIYCAMSRVHGTIRVKAKIAVPAVAPNTFTGASIYPQQKYQPPTIVIITINNHDHTVIDGIA